MKPLIYLAGRYSRRLELCGCRAQLREAGYNVQARWLDGEHQISDAGVPIGESGEALVEGRLRPGERLSPEDTTLQAAAMRQRFAQDDFCDDADILTCGEGKVFHRYAQKGFCETKWGFCETGQRRSVLIVGPRENIFCWLDDVRQFPKFHNAFAELVRECH